MDKKDKTPTVVGGINLSTRFKSKTFWVATVSALAVFTNQLTGAFGLDYSSQVEQGVNIVGSILTLLAGLGILVDNNTKGIKDSVIVQTDYHEPRDSKDPEKALTWEHNKVEDNVVDNTKTPKEYGTDEDFSDVDPHVYDADEEPFKDQAKPYGVNWDETVDTTKNIDTKEEGVIDENPETSRVLH
ncbi:holin [Staphylococcus phage Twort]|uniref:ORF176 n=3 Tax=Twortvirus twort TaxID=55510 RepID=Q4Z8Y8_BPTWO|nr:holin [Staphylococcus phage Twort]AAX92447.1 ORF176 [Staphylococcus phage Twort]QIW89076.1 holin [Staphylococcus phage Twort]CAA69020.1 holTW [Twortvirus twort]